MKASRPRGGNSSRLETLTESGTRLPMQKGHARLHGPAKRMFAKSSMRRLPRHPQRRGPVEVQVGGAVGIALEEVALDGRGEEERDHPVDVGRPLGSEAQRV